MSNKSFNSDALAELLDISEVSDGRSAPSPQTAAVSNLNSQMESMQKAISKSKDMIENFDMSSNSTDSIDKSLNAITSELSSLLAKSNDLVDHCKYCIESQMLMDGEMVSAVSSLIGTTQSIISSFTTLFRDRVKFLHAIELEKLKFQNKKDFSEHYLRLKAQYDPKNINQTDEDIQKHAYRQEDILKEIIHGALNDDGKGEVIT